MREIKILTNTTPSANYIEIEERMQKCLQVEKNDKNLPALLDKVRGGDTAMVQEVLEASQSMIYKVMLTMTDSRFSINERVNVASDALKRLARKELNSPDPVQFLRFDAWCVRQSLLELEKKSSLRGTKQSYS